MLKAVATAGPGIVLLIGWRNRWKIAVWIAFAICMAIGILADPWLTEPPKKGEDGDIAFWDSHWRIFSFLWGVVFIIALMCSIRVKHRKRRRVSHLWFMTPMD